MTLRFTAQDAFDCAAEGEPIMMTAAAAVDLCAQHDANIGDFLRDTDSGPFAGWTEYRADRILAWLGY